jgi:uncharacterized protein (UPF0335 family)
MIPTESVKAWEAGEKYLIEKIHRLQEENAALQEKMAQMMCESAEQILHQKNAALLAALGKIEFALKNHDGQTRLNKIRAAIEEAKR